MSADSRYSPAQERALVYVPKVTATISILGSSFIILDIMRDKKKHRQTYYNLILCISCFDIVTSIGYFLGTWPMPGVTGIYGASGTTGTCTFQGVLVQLGIAVPLYNLCLSIHYLLIIAYTWKDSRLKKAERWMHVLVLSWAFSTAIAALPLTLYNPADLWCWISSLPPKCANSEMHSRNVPCKRGHHAWIYRYVFYFGPLWLAALLITVAMAKVSYVTWVGERTSRKYRTDRQNTCSDKTRSLTRQVHIQALWYVGAFCITYAFPTIIRAMQTAGATPPYGIYLCVTIFAPLQGFFNAATYVRPRYVRYKAKNPNVSVWNACLEVVLVTIGNKKTTEAPIISNDATRRDCGETGDHERSNGNLRRRSSIQNNNVAEVPVECDDLDDADVLDPGQRLRQSICTRPR